MTRRGLRWLAVGLGAASAVPPGLLLWQLHAQVTIGLGAMLILGLATWRVVNCLLDPPRPRWLVDGIDLPATAIWASGLLALPIQICCAGVGWVLACTPFQFVASWSWAVGFSLAAWGVWVRRKRVWVHEVRVEVAGLPTEFDGYRIAHLSDLHIGSVDGIGKLHHWVRLTNARCPDAVVVTGDWVTSGSQHYRAVGTALQRLEAPDGVWVVNGNHDLWDVAAWTRAANAAGLHVLLNRTSVIERGAARLELVGVDCSQDWKSFLSRPVEGEAEVRILLAHYPEAFRSVLGMSASLTLAGHTHGGQIATPWLERRWNLTRLLGGPASGFTRGTHGALYVSRGLGTTGIPMRLGAPPEIPLIELRVGLQDASSLPCD